MRIAHLSDLHFSQISWNPAQLFCKRWLGNLNLLFRRKRQFDPNQLKPLTTLFKTLNVDLVLISGDLTTTSFSKEFRLAKEFVEEIQNLKIPVATLPGNHDQYTKSAYKKNAFYSFFPETKNPTAQFNLKEHGVQVQELSEGWHLVLIDTAIATTLFSSRGHFSESTEKHLDELLSRLPAHSSVIMANHYPFFQPDEKRRGLERGAALNALVKRHPAIKLYLHGHTHRQIIADLRASALPIVLDSGSTTHTENGTWNLLELSKNSCSVQPYQWKQGSGWNSSEVRRFHFEK